MSAHLENLDFLSDEDLDAALADCDAEPVHIPGRIQPHGAILGVHARTLTVCYASQNTTEILGMDPVDLFQGTLRDHFEPNVQHTLCNAIQEGPPAGDVMDQGRMTVGDRDVWVASCAAGDYSILQFEPIDDVDAPPEAVLRDLSFMMRKMDAVESQDCLFRTTVEMLRTLMGYDRVLIYKLDASGHGSVIAESVSDGLEPYIGLHFPKWDIPAQARDIMGKIPMRFIADVDAPAVPVLKAHPVLPELDMTAATLRGVSEIHLEYLRNMGQFGTVTLHLHHRGMLWGVISMMNVAPRCPPQSKRQLCVQFARHFQAKLSFLVEAERIERLKRADALRKSIGTAASEKGIGTVFEADLLAELRNAMNADGAAVVLNENLIVSGDTPSSAILRDLLTRSDDAEDRNGTFLVSSELSKDHPALADLLGPDFPGVMLVRLRDRITFAFFRRDKERSVSWAGAPEKSVEVVKGRARLRPRGSFAVYKMCVKGTSEPWDDQALRIADDLWALLAIAERRDMVEKTNRKQQILINELNHRVRNILALIRSLSQQSLRHNGSIESYVRALEARINAVAVAHDLGAEAANAGATAGQIIQVEAAPYNTTQDRVLISGDDMAVRDDLAPLFALVIHELMTNAVKYGALSNDSGTVRVTLSITEHEFEINWQETGGPKVEPKRGSGFGTILISTSVPYELSGHVSMDYEPSGLKAQIRLPKAVMVNRTAINLNAQGKPPLPPVPNVSERPIVVGKCILLEDNFVVALDTKNVLEKVGFQNIEVVSSVEDCLIALNGSPPTFAVLDVNLGKGMTSSAAAYVLKERGIPFVFVTGYGEVAPVEDDLQNTALLKKPVREDELARVIDMLSQ